MHFNLTSVNSSNFNNFSVDLRINSLEAGLEKLINAPYPDFEKIASLLTELMQVSEAEGLVIFNRLEEKFSEAKSNRWNSSLLYKLIDFNYNELVLLLIKLNVPSIHSKNEFEQESILHIAAKRGHLDVVKALVESGKMDPNSYYIDRFRSEKTNKVSALASCIVQLDDETRKNLKYVNVNELTGKYLEFYNEEKTKFDKIIEVFNFLVLHNDNLNP